MTGWLDDGVLGIVQNDEMDIEALEASVRTHSKIADPKGIGLTPKAASLSMDSSGLHPGDAAQALLYAINRFAEVRGVGVQHRLSQGWLRPDGQGDGQARC